MEINNEASYKFGSQQSSRPQDKAKLEEVAEEAVDNHREEQGQDDEDRTDFDDRDDEEIDLDAEDVDLADDDQLYSHAELERYKELIELAIQEQLLGESQASSMSIFDKERVRGLDPKSLTAQPQRERKEKDGTERRKQDVRASKHSDSTFNRDDDSQFHDFGDSYTVGVKESKDNLKVAESVGNQTFDRASSINASSMSKAAELS